MNKEELIEYVVKNVPGYIDKVMVEVIAINEQMKSPLDITIEEAIILVGKNLGADMSQVRSSEQTVIE